MCGRLHCNILTVLDFDETLARANGGNEDFTVLTRLRQLGVELCVASRNDRYHLENQLRHLKIRSCFRYIMADFRPKSYQLKHLLWLYGKMGCQFKKVLFVDDFLPNIRQVRKDLPNVQCFQFGCDIHSLVDLIELM
jgi:predicted phosphatase